jgi:hypothetical protein
MGRLPVNPAFYFAVYRDEPLALRLAQDVRRHYPAAEIVAVGDGPVASWFHAAMAALGVAFVPGLHLKQAGHGGAAAHRNLQAVLSHTTADLLIQLDPDSILHRPFVEIPDDPWFGQMHVSRCTWYPVHPFGTLHGACWGMRREVAELAVRSGLLLEPAYCNRPILWEYPLPRDNNRRLPRLDLIWGDVARQLGYAPTTWAEVSGGLLMAPTGHWAATHPHS